MRQSHAFLNHRVVVAVALALAANGSSSLSAQIQSSVLLGTWTLDVARSKVDYGALPKSEVRTYEVAAAGGIRLSVEGVDGAGATFAYSANGDFNGKDYPFVGAGTRNGGDTVSWKPIDAFTIDGDREEGRFRRQRHAPCGFQRWQGTDDH